MRAPVRAGGGGGVPSSLGARGDFSQLGDLVRAGAVNESALDVALSRVLAVRVRQGEFDPPGSVPFRDDVATYGPDAFDADPRWEAASREAATQSLALLRNANATLPFGPDPAAANAAGGVAIFGCLVRAAREGLGGAVFADCPVAATAGYDSGAGYNLSTNDPNPPVETAAPDEALRALGFDARFVDASPHAGGDGWAADATNAAAAAAVSIVIVGRAGAEGESGDWCTARTCGDNANLTMPADQRALLEASEGGGRF